MMKKEITLFSITTDLSRIANASLYAFFTGIILYFGLDKSLSSSEILHQFILILFALSFLILIVELTKLLLQFLTFGAIALPKAIFREK